MRQARHAPPQRFPWFIYVIAILAVVGLTTALTLLATSAGASGAEAAAPAAHPARAVTVYPDRDKAAITSARFRAGLAAAKAARIAAARIYTVRPGDTLSSVAARECGNSKYWTGIYQASRAWGWTARDANQLSVGQRLRIFCAYEPSMLSSATTSAPRIVLTRQYSSAPVQSPRSYAATTYHGSTSYQQCVISRESGGNSQVMNGSGHYGLYQFSYDTWKAYGGPPGDFGHASAAEQTQIYENVVAAGATYGTWSEWDGC